jgi:hypothetical protein
LLGRSYDYLHLFGKGSLGLTDIGFTFHADPESVMFNNFLSFKRPSVPISSNNREVILQHGTGFLEVFQQNFISQHFLLLVIIILLCIRHLSSVRLS